MKPGIKTTEFWLTLLAQIVGALLAADIVPSDSLWMRVAGAVAMILTGLGYTVSRGVAKAAQERAAPSSQSRD